MVELYLYSPYGLYGLYRASVLYKGALYLTLPFYLKIHIPVRPNVLLSTSE